MPGVQPSPSTPTLPPWRPRSRRRRGGTVSRAKTAAVIRRLQEAARELFQPGHPARLMLESLPETASAAELDSIIPALVRAVRAKGGP